MRKFTNNTFSEGWNTDIHPLSTNQKGMTDAVNATFLTQDGNELLLQNDKGNVFVGDTRLEKDFIPIGIKEYGNILYIASINPFTNEFQLGSIPGPEYETFEGSLQLIGDINIDFVNSDTVDLFKDSDSIKKSLFRNLKEKLNPGDVYVIGYSDNSVDNSLSLYKLLNNSFVNLTINKIINDDEVVFENANIKEISSIDSSTYDPSNGTITNPDSNIYTDIGDKSCTLFAETKLSQNINDIGIAVTTSNKHVVNKPWSNSTTFNLVQEPAICGQLPNYVEPVYQQKPSINNIVNVDYIDSATIGDNLATADITVNNNVLLNKTLCIKSNLNVNLSEPMIKFNHNGTETITIYKKISTTELVKVLDIKSSVLLQKTNQYLTLNSNVNSKIQTDPFSLGVISNNKLSFSNDYWTTQTKKNSDLYFNIFNQKADLYINIKPSTYEGCTIESIPEFYLHNNSEIPVYKFIITNNNYIPFESLEVTLSDNLNSDIIYATDKIEITDYSIDNLDGNIINDKIVISKIRDIKSVVYNDGKLTYNLTIPYWNIYNGKLYAESHDINCTIIRNDFINHTKRLTDGFTENVNYILTWNVRSVSQTTLIDVFQHGVRTINNKEWFCFNLKFGYNLAEYYDKSKHKFYLEFYNIFQNRSSIFDIGNIPVNYDQTKLQIYNDHKLVTNFDLNSSSIKDSIKSGYTFEFRFLLIPETNVNTYKKTASWLTSYPVLFSYSSSTTGVCEEGYTLYGQSVDNYLYPIIEKNQVYNCSFLFYESSEDDGDSIIGLNKLFRTDSTFNALYTNNGYFITNNSNTISLIKDYSILPSYADNSGRDSMYLQYPHWTTLNTVTRNPLFVGYDENYNNKVTSSIENRADLKPLYLADAYIDHSQIGNIDGNQNFFMFSKNNNSTSNNLVYFYIDFDYSRVYHPASQITGDFDFFIKPSNKTFKKEFYINDVLQKWSDTPLLPANGDKTLTVDLNYSPKTFYKEKFVRKCNILPARTNFYKTRFPASVEINGKNYVLSPYHKIFDTGEYPSWFPFNSKMIQQVIPSRESYSLLKSSNNDYTGYYDEGNVSWILLQDVIDFVFIHVDKTMNGSADGTVIGKNGYYNELYRDDAIDLNPAYYKKNSSDKLIYSYPDLEGLPSLYYKHVNTNNSYSDIKMVNKYKDLKLAIPPYMVFCKTIDNTWIDLNLQNSSSGNVNDWESSYEKLKKLSVYISEEINYYINSCNLTNIDDNFQVNNTVSIKWSYDFNYKYKLWDKLDNTISNSLYELNNSINDNVKNLVNNRINNLRQNLADINVNIIELNPNGFFKYLTQYFDNFKTPLTYIDNVNVNQLIKNQSYTCGGKTILLSDLESVNQQKEAFNLDFKKKFDLLNEGSDNHYLKIDDKTLNLKINNDNYVYNGVILIDNDVELNLISMGVELDNSNSYKNRWRLGDVTDKFDNSQSIYRTSTIMTFPIFLKNKNSKLAHITFNSVVNNSKYNSEFINDEQRMQFANVDQNARGKNYFVPFNIGTDENQKAKNFRYFELVFPNDDSGIFDFVANSSEYPLNVQLADFYSLGVGKNSHVRPYSNKWHGMWRKGQGGIRSPYVINYSIEFFLYPTLNMCSLESIYKSIIPMFKQRKNQITF